MAVPAHDERDYEFARAFDLADPRGRRRRRGGRREDEPYSGDGPMVNSGPLRRRATTARPTRRSSSGCAERAAASAAVNYRLRDWLLSRQRYWGCPIPIVYCERVRDGPGAGRPAPGGAPRGRGLRAEGAAARWPRPRTGSTPSARSAAARRAARPTRWTPSSTPPGTSSATSTRTTRSCRSTASAPTTGCRSTSTSAGSSTRSCTSCTRASSPRRSPTWATSSVQEPFANLFTQGMITMGGAKMSSSKGNTVSAVETVERYGADTARTYVCFLGPPERGGDWVRRGRRGRPPLPRPPLAPLERGRRTHRAPSDERRASPRRTGARALAKTPGRSTRSPTTSATASRSTPRSPR